MPKSNQQAIIEFFSRFRVTTINSQNKQYPDSSNEIKNVIIFDGDFEREKEILMERLDVNSNSFFSDKPIIEPHSGGHGGG